MGEIEDDTSTAAGVEGAATAAPSEIRLDEDGQPMSKSALKKLLKKEAADKKKAEKAATRVSASICGRSICPLPDFSSSSRCRRA
jgi:hypothetical protein